MFAFKSKVRTKVSL